jgi:hypothetical protein
MMTVHSKKREFLAALARIKDEDQEFARNGEKHFTSVSREREMILFEGDRISFSAPDVIARINPETPLAPEFTKAVVEHALLCFSRDSGDFLQSFWNAVVSGRSNVLEAANSLGCYPNEMGTGIFTRNQLEALRFWITENPKRYQAIHSTLSERFGSSYKVRFDYLLGGSENFEVPGYPALAISLAQDSPNIGFCPEFMGRYLDFFQGPAQLISALFSNSAILGNRLGKRYNNRLFLWRKAMSRKGQYTPYSLGSYTDVQGPQVLEHHLRFVHDRAKQILTMQQAGKSIEEFRPWPSLRLLSGTLWLLSVRLQWRHNDEGKIVLWLEVRSLDAQPTLGMSFAVELAMIGYALYWIKKKGVDSITEVMPHDTARRCFEHILMHGPDSELPLPASPRGVQWFEKVAEQAIEGLLEDEVCPLTFAESAMSLLTGSLRNGTTGTSWMRRKVDKFMTDSKMTEEEAIRASATYFGNVKSEQCTQYGNFRDQGLPVIK